MTFIVGPLYNDRDRHPKTVSFHLGLDPLVEAGVVHAAVRRTTEANWGANKLHPRLIAETRQPVDSASG